MHGELSRGVAHQCTSEKVLQHAMQIHSNSPVLCMDFMQYIHVHRGIMQGSRIRGGTAEPPKQ